MNINRRIQGLQTRMIHRAHAANDTTAVSPPIFQTSTFALRTPEEGAELSEQVAPAMYYTRYGSPNTKQAEVLLSDRRRNLSGPDTALRGGGEWRRYYRGP